MAVNAFISNQGTQTNLLTDNTGGTGGTLIPIYKLSLDAQGTFTNGNIFQGTILQVNNLGTLPNLPGGTINSDTIVGGTLNAGTFQLSGGTLNLGTITGNIGTIGTLGLGSVVVNTLPNLPQGSINVTAGTITSGSIIVTNGTIGAGTLNTGTINLGSIVKITPAATAGSFTAAGTITVAGSQLDYAGFDAGGTWVGTVFTEAQIGTSAWFAIPYVTPTGGYGTSFTGNGDYFVSMAGVDGVRARLTYSSGTFNYNARQSNFFAPLHYLLGGTLGNVGMLNGGTINSSTINTGTINNGTFVMPSGTLNVGTINAGTINNGSIVVTAGTVSAGTINTGTMNVGTINTGTINTGTFRPDARTTQNIVSFGTQVGFSGAGAATIVGSASVGSGTSLWINDASIFNFQSGAGTFILGFGTTQQGTNVLFRAPLGTNGAVGMEKPWPKAVNAGMTNQDLVLSATGAGTVDLSISYFISA